MGVIGHAVHIEAIGGIVGDVEQGNGGALLAGVHRVARIGWVEVHLIWRTRVATQHVVVTHLIICYKLAAEGRVSGLYEVRNYF